MMQFDAIRTLTPINLAIVKATMRGKIDSSVTHSEFQDFDTAEFEEPDDLREFFVD